jgi:hypothetical protein
MFGESCPISGRDLPVRGWDGIIGLTDSDVGIIGLVMTERSGNQIPLDLVRHVAASTGLPEATAGRVVADVAAYFAESVEEYVRRRHGEMRAMHWKNDNIWPQIAAELGTRRFGAPNLSERQLRRIVYG